MPIFIHNYQDYGLGMPLRRLLCCFGCFKSSEIEDDSQPEQVELKPHTYLPIHPNLISTFSVQTAAITNQEHATKKIERHEVKFPNFLVSASNDRMELSLMYSQIFSEKKSMEQTLERKAKQSWEMLTTINLEEYSETDLCDDIYHRNITNLGIDTTPYFAENESIEMDFYLSFRGMFTSHSLKIKHKSRGLVNLRPYSEFDKEMKSKPFIHIISNEPKLIHSLYRVYLNFKRTEISKVLCHLSVFMNSSENKSLHCKFSIQKRFSSFINHTPCDKLVGYCTSFKQAKELCEHFSKKPTLLYEDIPIISSTIPGIDLTGYGVTLNLKSSLKEVAYIHPKAVSWSRLMAIIFYNCFIFLRLNFLYQMNYDTYRALIILVIVKLNINPMILYQRLTDS
ncbi:hypothetical protein [Pelagibaculum spongiae]|uniref:Uncharacterized protein n=1 Tax=Pelagibaculum spongiae TaxID=2080658 RepID=A0A2V1GZ94_9GAMM|nr:hypothetical protein [Pelagibaculum spongiae]PVZ68315.1 hypothetical protein DC094_13595 [Pelagibaculum spongiae]